MLLLLILIRFLFGGIFMNEPNLLPVIKPIGEELDYTCPLSSLQERELTLCSLDTCTLCIQKQDNVSVLVGKVASQGATATTLATFDDTGTGTLRIMSSKGAVCLFFISMDGIHYTRVGEEFNAGGVLMINF